MALALRTPVWGFHTVRGSIALGDHNFRPRFAVVDVCVWNDLLSGDGTFFSLGVAGSYELGFPHRAGRF